MDKQKIQAKARMLMKLDSSIWKKYGWQNGSQVNLDLFKKELRKKVKPRSLDYIYYHIFEDANYHSLNTALEEIGAFKGTYADTEEEYNAYRTAGGKTWNL